MKKKLKKISKKNPVCYLECIPSTFNDDDIWGSDEYVSLMRRDGFELLGLCCEQLKKFTGYLPPKGKRVKVRFSVEVIK